MTERKWKTIEKTVYEESETPPDELIDPLNHKQRRFCEEYVKDLKQYDAYVKAGYQGRDESGWSASSRLLHDDNLKRYINWLLRRKTRRNEAKADNVLKELAGIAFSNIRDFVKWNEHSITLTPSDDLPDELCSIIHEVIETNTNQGRNIRIKLFSKVRALEMLAQHFQLLGDKRPEDDDNARDKAQKIKVEFDAIMGSVPAREIPQRK